MKVRITKVKEKNIKDVWTLFPMLSKPHSDVFAITKTIYLWYSNIIIGFRRELNKPVKTSFDNICLDLSQITKN